MAYLNVFYFYKKRRREDAFKPVSLYHMQFECWKHFAFQLCAHSQYSGTKWTFWHTVTCAYCIYSIPYLLYRIQYVYICSTTIHTGTHWRQSLLRDKCDICLRNEYTVTVSHVIFYLLKTHTTTTSFYGISVNKDEKMIKKSFDVDKN